MLNKGEKEQLFSLCLKHKIPIIYPNLFEKDEPHHYLWGFDSTGVALLGTIIMRDLSKKNKVLYGVCEMENFLKRNWRESYVCRK